MQQYIKIQYLKLFLLSVFCPAFPMEVANFIVEALSMKHLLNHYGFQPT